MLSELVACARAVLCKPWNYRTTCARKQVLRITFRCSVLLPPSCLSVSSSSSVSPRLLVSSLARSLWLAIYLSLYLSISIYLSTVDLHTCICMYGCALCVPPPLPHPTPPPTPATKDGRRGGVTGAQPYIAPTLTYWSSGLPRLLRHVAAFRGCPGSLAEFSELHFFACIHRDMQISSYRYIHKMYMYRYICIRAHYRFKYIYI